MDSQLSNGSRTTFDRDIGFKNNEENKSNPILDLNSEIQLKELMVKYLKLVDSYIIKYEFIIQIMREYNQYI